MNQSEFFAQVCRRMPARAKGPWPVTELSLSVLNAWALMEFPDRDGNGMTDLFEAAWNPLATTWLDESSCPRSSIDIGYGPGKWNLANNGQGVGIYRDAESGITATVLTLAQTNYYPHIQTAFSEQRYVEGLKENFQTYIGDPGYSRNLADFFKSAVETKNVVDRVAELNAAVMDRFALINLATGTDHLRIGAALEVLKKAGFSF